MKKKGISVYILLAIFIVPLLILLFGSVSNSHMGTMSFEEYKNLFNDIDYIVTVKNSLLITLIGGIAGTIICFVTAYGLTYINKKSYIIIFLVACTILDPGVIAGFLFYTSTKIINTVWVYFADNIISPFYILLCMLYLSDTEVTHLREMSKIDGCTEFKHFTSILIPNSGDMLATIFIFNAFDLWANYTTAQYYIFDKEKINLSQLINVLLQSANQRQLQGTIITDNYYGFVCAATVTYLLPVVFLLIIFRKQVLSYIGRYIELHYLTQ